LQPISTACDSFFPVVIRYLACVPAFVVLSCVAACMCVCIIHLTVCDCHAGLERRLLLYYIKKSPLNFGSHTDRKAMRCPMVLILLYCYRTVGCCCCICPSLVTVQRFYSVFIDDCCCWWGWSWRPIMMLELVLVLGLWFMIHSENLTEMNVCLYVYFSSSG